MVSIGHPWLILILMLCQPLPTISISPCRESILQMIQMPVGMVSQYVVWLLATSCLELIAILVKISLQVKNRDIMEVSKFFIVTSFW